ncbi:MAG: N-acetyltransferase [Chloroflexi bacterium]|nr:MAG: N-acetyltransferase [Chloroflexota bacterium]
MTDLISIETSRLLLRPYAKDDVDDVLAYCADEAFSQYLPAVPFPYSRENAVTFLASTALLDPRVHASWAIEFEGHAIGGISLRIEPDMQRASLGYGIGQHWWGRGITTEAAQAVVAYGFDTLDLERIFATADARNIGSQRVMQHLGMKHEGTLRSHRIARGERVDEVWYGLLRSERNASTHTA